VVEKEANKDVVLFLIGNKSDLEGARAVTYEEGKSLADSLKIGFIGIQYYNIETSAKTSSNVEKAFFTII
jgi:GTPase SAR1 family protein